MPYANVPTDKTDEMDRCVQKVQSEQGVDKDSAIAICYASVIEGEERRRTEHVQASIKPQKGPDFQGREWEVTLIGAQTPEDVQRVDGRAYIKSKNGRLYSVEGLKKSVPMWEGVRVYDNHLTDAEFEERAGMRSVVGEWLGTIVQPTWDESKKQLRGTLKIVEEGVARKLFAAHQQGILDTIGLSIDTIPIGHEALVEGKRGALVEGFSKIFSVDLVAEPAAGGAFERLIAAQQHTEERKMGFSEEQINEIKRLIAEALGSQTQEQMEPESPEEVIEEVEMAVEEVAASAPADADPAQVAQAAANAAQDVADEIAGEEEEQMPENEEVAKLETKLALHEKLDASKLPEKAKAIIKEAFQGRIAKPEAIDKMIKNVREAVAQSDPTGRVSGAGKASNITVGLNGDDWRELEFLRLVGGNMGFRALEAKAKDHEIVADRMPESYNTWIKNGRPRGNARRMSEWLYEAYGDPFARAYESATTSSLSSIVKNTVNILLAADFAVRHQWWQPIVREEEFDTIDQATLVRFYGVSNLDEVNEGAAYTEKKLTDEEETADFVKRGNYIGITLETLLRDKVNKVRRLPELLADAWYNTLSNQVATVFTTNTAAGPVLADTGALFNATATTSAGGHANLLTAALTYTAYGAARTAMAKQTTGALGTGPRALIRPRYLLVPVDLESAAIQITQSENIPGSANNDPNAYRDECEVIVVPEWTDANNWAFVADPQQFPAIWMLYYRGKRVPELFTSDSETQGAMFTNDELRYKVRQMTFYFSSTYTCAPVSDWRGLHKSNVA